MGLKSVLGKAAAKVAKAAAAAAAKKTAELFNDEVRPVPGLPSKSISKGKEKKQ